MAKSKTHITMSLVLTWVTDQTWQVMLLTTAPASVTELVLTAKILEDGLAIVTAFRVVRLFIILPFADSKLNLQYLWQTVGVAR